MDVAVDDAVTVGSSVLALVLRELVLVLVLREVPLGLGVLVVDVAGEGVEVE